MEISKFGRLTDPRDFILDLVRKSFVELVSECRFAPSDSCCESVKISTSPSADYLSSRVTLICPPCLSPDGEVRSYS